MLCVQVLRVAESSQILLLGWLRDTVVQGVWVADVVSFLRVVSVIEGALRGVMMLVCADDFTARGC